MKKSLIALAVAGAFAAPAAFAASANVDVYGIMNVALQDTDESTKDLQVTDNFSRVGLKGSEDLGGGLKGVWQIESGLGKGSDGMGTGEIGTRNTFVGLAGGFGTAVIGRHDTPYKMATGKYDMFGDTIADYNLGRLGVSIIENTHDHRNPDAIAYISPSFSGLTIAAAVVSTNAAANLNSGDTFDAVSVAAMYANGPLTVDLAYQDVKAVDNDGLKLGVGYKFGDAKVGFVYEKTDDAGVADVRDGDSWLLNGSYAMGPITLKAMYGEVDVNKTKVGDGDMFALGADYALSKRTTAYFVYGQGDVDVGTDIDGWNLGVKHSF
jgi:predicted porin